MFGKKASRPVAGRHSLAAVRLNHENACRRLADKIGEFDQTLRRLHPELITPLIATEMRSALLDLLAELRTNELAMADFIRAIGEAGDGSGYS